MQLLPHRRGGPETAENNLNQCAGRVGRMALRGNTNGSGGPPSCLFRAGPCATRPQLRVLMISTAPVRLNAVPASKANRRCSAAVPWPFPIRSCRRWREMTAPTAKHVTARTTQVDAAKWMPGSMGAFLHVPAQSYRRGPKAPDVKAGSWIPRRAIVWIALPGPAHGPHDQQRGGNDDGRCHNYRRQQHHYMPGLKPHRSPFRLGGLSRPYRSTGQDRRGRALRRETCRLRSKRRANGVWPPGGGGPLIPREPERATYRSRRSSRPVTATVDG